MFGLKEKAYLTALEQHSNLSITIHSAAPLLFLLFFLSFGGGFTFARQTHIPHIWLEVLDAFDANSTTSIHTLLSSLTRLFLLLGYLVIIHFLGQISEDHFYVHAAEGRGARMLDANATRVRLSLAQLHRTRWLVRFVPGKDYWRVWSNIPAQFHKPRLYLCKGVLICDVVYKERTRGSLVVIFGECVVLFLPRRIPNIHLYLLFANLDLFGQETGIHCRSLVRIKCVVHKSQQEGCFTNTSYTKLTLLQYSLIYDVRKMIKKLIGKA